MSATPMSATLADPDHLLATRGVRRALDAHVIAVAFDRSGGHAAFACGDGMVHRVAAEAPEDWAAVEAHDGGVMALAAAPAPGLFVTGGDDGRLCRVSPDGTVTEVASFGRAWVEQVAAWTDGKAVLMACGVGKAAHVFGADGRTLKVVQHATTVSGVAFDAKGKRLACSHYNGVTLWFVNAKVDSPRVLEWKGSHTGVAVHPGGDAVVSCMQENSLHGWRLADGQHMRMSGYPTKTESLSFSRTGKWLATAGAESVVLWPFFGGGPMGKAPLELAGGDGMSCTRVAFNPVEDMVAAGFSDGMVVVVDVASERVLPIAGPGKGPISGLAWIRDGSGLAFGTETGFAALVDLSPR